MCMCIYIYVYIYIYIYIYILTHSRIRKSGVESAQEKVGRETRAYGEKKSLRREIFVLAYYFDARVRTHARKYYIRRA